MTLLQRDSENREEGRDEVREEGMEEELEEDREEGRITMVISLYQEGVIAKKTCARKLNISMAGFDELLRENK